LWRHNFNDMSGTLKKDDNGYPVSGGVSSSDANAVLPLKISPITGRLQVDSAAGSGTVTDVTVVTANGFAGSVATSTTTPAITLSTTVTGILSGNGTAISAATTTGSGDVVLATSPTLVTPNIGAATGTSLTTSGALRSNTSLILEETGAGTDTITVQAPASIAASYTLTLPVDDGNSGELLSTNGSGTLSWVPSTGVVPTAITVANEATDATCFLAFFTAATGDLGPKTNVNMTFNSNTGVLTLVAPVLGTPTSATLTNATGLPVSSGISGLGTNVATALAVNVGSAGAFVTFNGALGTPSSGTVTNLTGTASININGTVGATTPAAGTFTTVTANSFVPNSSTIPTNGLYLPAANTLGWAVNSGAELQLTSTALSPAADGGSSLGTTALGWQNLFGNTGFVLNIENSDWVATHTTGILTVGTGDLRVTTAGSNSASVVTVGGSQTLTSKTLTSPTLTTPSAFTTGGTITLAENTSIALDPAGSADGKYTGITVTGTAGYTQAFGDLNYLAVADSRWEKTDADASATAGPVMLGMVVSAGTDGNPCTLLLQGIIRADAAFPALTVGAPVYVGETAGAIQVAIPTGADNVIRVVGFALTADEIYFNPSGDHQITVA
jgi:hypothetical protein